MVAEVSYTPGPSVWASTGGLGTGTPPERALHLGTEQGKHTYQPTIAVKSVSGHPLLENRPQGRNNVF